MNNQRVSVVITTHFRDDMLAECLESLAAQTLPLHEVVVVDDGGSGSARGVVERFGSRFRYLWQPNCGMQNARNHGARASTGEWIAFLDDDDLWLPERHALVAESMATGQVDFISGDFTKFGEGWVAPTGVFAEVAQQSPGFWGGIPHESGATYSIVGSFPTTRLLPVCPFWPSTLVIRRDLFERLKGWNEILKGIKSEDIEFVFRAIKSGQLGIIWTPTVHYRVHAGNDSNSTLSVALGQIHVWGILLNDPNTSEDEKLSLVKAINNALHGILFSAFSSKEYKVVLRASKNIDRLNLSLSEKIKVAISRIIVAISSIKNY
ncbi:MAG TPA: hypothetical protein DCP03_17120 [Polaromonas sp.]|nr:hypothetical protein [Polaromonas sp.]